MVATAAWTAPLGCIVLHACRSSFLRSVPMRQRYIAIVVLSRSSQRSVRTLVSGRRPAHLPHRPHAPLRRPRRRPGPALGRARAPPTRCARDEAADAATGERAAATARELVKQLGQMRGAAMKIGQVLSTVDFTAIPESEREEFKATLAALRDDVPPLPFKRDREAAQGGARRCRSSEAFGEFEHEAFAAASIGQVHRAVTTDGQRASRSRSSTRASPRRSRPTCATCRCCFPLVKRLAPGPRRQGAGRRSCASASATSSTTRSRPRTTARWRAPGAATRSCYVPPVDTELSPPPRARHRAASRAAASRRSSSSTTPSATASARSSSASSSARSSHLRRAAGDPHPGNYLLLDDGRVGFLDFGLMRVVDADYLEGERALAQAVDAPATRTRVHARLAALGYLPEPGRRSTPSACSRRSRPPASGTSSPASAASRPPT